MNNNSDKWKIRAYSSAKIPRKNLGIVDTSSKAINFGHLVQATLADSKNIKATLITCDDNIMHSVRGILSCGKPIKTAVIPVLSRDRTMQWWGKGQICVWRTIEMWLGLMWEWGLRSISRVGIC
jgi:hypothetical protein